MSAKRRSKHAERSRNVEEAVSEYRAASFASVDLRWREETLRELDHSAVHDTIGALMSSHAPQSSSIPWWAIAVPLVLCVGVFGLATGGASAPEPIANEPAEAVMPANATLASASEHVSIEMYSAAWCQACSAAKAWMRQQGVQYHEVDVDHGQGALAQLQVLNPNRTLPTFDVEGQVLVGFRPDELESAIRRGAAH